jgi:hypothetical protein
MYINLTIKKVEVVIGLILAMSASYAQTVDLTQGLQAHYPFSGNADDHSGNEYNGTTFGSPTLTTDRFGNANSAYEFDGFNDLINTQTTFDYPERTLSLWLNPYDINSSGTSVNVAITQDDYSLKNGILRVDFTNNQMKLWAGGESGTYVSTNVSTYAWMHLVLIRDNKLTKYYVNNILVHTSTSDGYGSTFNPVPDFIIGSGRSTIYQFFEGKIDDIRVYNRAINACEIEALFSGTTPNLSDSLQAHYPFSGNADDHSGNEYNGTTFGSPTLTTDRFGNENSAYEFDGFNDLINTQTTFDYPKRTVSLWINPYDINSSGTSVNVAITQDDYTLNNGILRVDFTNNQMKLWAGGGSGTYVSTNVATYAWMHLVLIRDNELTKYYVNNILVHTSTSDGYGSTFNPFPDFIIGSGRSSIYQFFEGKIDDIRIYNRAITSCEVDSLFNEDDITSVENYSSEKPTFNIFPNPTNSTLAIEKQSASNYVKVDLMNHVGQIIETLVMKDTTLIINMESLPSGIYYLQILSDQYNVIRKVIKN